MLSTSQAISFDAVNGSKVELPCDLGVKLTKEVSTERNSHFEWAYIRKKVYHIIFYDLARSFLISDVVVCL